MPLVPRPTGPEVAGLVRRRLELEDGAAELLTMHAETAAQVIADLARDFTRGRGWDLTGEWCTPAIRGVVLLGAARLASETGQADYVSDGAVDDSDLAERSVRGGGWKGWTLAELAILNTYRRTLGTA